MAFKYNMKHDFRGTALIIGNEFKYQGLSERSGCKEDVRMIKEVFGKLDFNVTTFMNLTAAKMREKLERVPMVVRKDTSKEKNVSPGADIWRNVVYGEDRNFLLVDDIIDYFTDKKAVGLVDKPKLFFLQACRSRSQGQYMPSQGDKYDQGVEVDVSSGVQGLTDKLKTTGVSKDSADWIHTIDLTGQADVSSEVQGLTDRLKATNISKDSADWIHTIDLTDADDIYKDWPKDPEEWDSEMAAEGLDSQASEVDAAGGFSQEDAGGSGEGSNMPPLPFDLVPTKCPDDFLIMYPVMSGKYAFRNEYGSHLIKFLHKGENLTKLISGCNVLQYLTHVCHDMARYESKPSLQNKANGELKTMMVENIKYLSREDNHDMLVDQIGEAHAKELEGDVAIVEANLQRLIKEKLTEKQMKDILDKILPFKMTACILHKLKGNVVFLPKGKTTLMGKVRHEYNKKHNTCMKN